MKRNLSTPVAVVLIVALVAVCGLVLYRTGGPAPGPDPNEAIKHMGLQSIEEAKASGPPAGRPPPSYPSREEMLRKKGQ